MSDEESEVASGDEIQTTDLIGDYKHGSIMEIRVQNFLTYGKAVIRPGPRLNMVIGPNGTGKSSILNAICLGLGGTPAVLGRADDVRAFVQHGKDKAVVEITLAPGEHTIRREMDRNKGSERGRGRGASSFYINGEKVTEAQVKQLVHETYHIQVENLCTFLPQDKVARFSGLTPGQYLEALEKTMPSNSYEQHQELIEMEHTLKNSSTDWKTLQNKLNSLIQEQERLEVEKERMQERREALETMEILDKKRLWLEVDHLRERAIALKERRDEAKRHYKEIVDAQQPARERLEEVQALVQARDQTIRQATLQTEKIQKECLHQRDKYDEHDREIDVQLMSWKEFENEESVLQNQIQAAEDRIAEIKEKNKGAPPKETIVDAETQAKEKAAHFRQKSKEAKRKASVLESALRDVKEAAARLQQKVASLANEKKQRRERILRQNRNLEQIDNWIQEHSAEFRKPVFGPIGCLVSPSSPHAAAILEQHVPNSVWKGFVVQTDADYQLLYQKIRQERGIAINIFKVERVREMKRPYSNAKMRTLKNEHGIEGYLDELLGECPDPVRQVLYVQAQIEKVLVGSAKTMESIDRRGLFEFLASPEEAEGPRKKNFVVVSLHEGKTLKFQGIVSRYNQELSIRQDEIKSANMLARGTDPAVQQRAENELKQVHEKLNELRPQFEDAQKENEEALASAQDAKGEWEAARTRLSDFNKMLHKLDLAEKKLEDLVNRAGEAKDKNKVKRKAEELMNRVLYSLKALETHAEKQKEIGLLKFSEIQANLGKSGIASKERRLREELDEMQKQVEELGKEAKDANKQFGNARDELRSKKAEADEKAPIKDDDGNDLPLREELENLNVHTLHEVESAYEDAEARANSIHDNPEALRKYEEQKEKIEELTGKLDDAKNAKTTQIESIKGIREGWERNLDQTVGKINALFSHYMADMDCAGEVALTKGEEGEGQYEGLGSFADWGIEIRVSFRAGSKLQVLDSMQQSGGERSVSTIMYLMAMQDLMVAPFRCVDEINQGLDDRNERLVFKRIVKNSTKRPKGSPLAHSGQYFLITPKLLPNLTDMEEEAMTILFVMNGPYNFQSPTQWSLEGIIGESKSQRKRRITGEEDDEENSGNLRSGSGKRNGKKNRSSPEA